MAIKVPKQTNESANKMHTLLKISLNHNFFMQWDNFNISRCTESMSTIGKALGPTNEGPKPCHKHLKKGPNWHRNFIMPESVELS